MAAVSKQEYLKRYLSSSDSGKKKKKKKVPKTVSKRPTSIIVDDDITVQDVAAANAGHETNEFEEDVDEAPAVYEDDGVTKISLETFKKREEDKKTKWAPISRDLQSSPDPKEDQEVNYDSDNSPPRTTNRRRQDTPDLSPQRGGLRDSPDQSPPRKRQDRSPPYRDRDLSSTYSERREPSMQADDRPPKSRRRRHDSGDSLPDQMHNHSPDPSQRHSHSKQRHSLISDGYNVRRARNDSPDLSPQRPGADRGSKPSDARKRTDSGSDQSPPRKRANTDSDQSPPRNRTNNDSDQSPPRKQSRSEGGTARRPVLEEQMSSG